MDKDARIKELEAECAALREDFETSDIAAKTYLKFANAHRAERDRLLKDLEASTQRVKEEHARAGYAEIQMQVLGAGLAAAKAECAVLRKVLVEIDRTDRDSNHYCSLCGHAESAHSKTCKLGLALKKVAGTK